MRAVSFGTSLWLNLPGLGAELTPDLAHFDFDANARVVDAVTLYSSRLNPAGAIHTPVRHFELA